jgi:hypothetical protein
MRATQEPARCEAASAFASNRNAEVCRRRFAIGNVDTIQAMRCCKKGDSPPGPRCDPSSSGERSEARRIAADALRGPLCGHLRVTERNRILVLAGPLGFDRVLDRRFVIPAAPRRNLYAGQQRNIGRPGFVTLAACRETAPRREHKDLRRSGNIGRSGKIRRHCSAPSPCAHINARVNQLSLLFLI